MMLDLRQFGIKLAQVCTYSQRTALLPYLEGSKNVCVCRVHLASQLNFVDISMCHGHGILEKYFMAHPKALYIYSKLNCVCNTTVFTDIVLWNISRAINYVL